MTIALIELPQSASRDCGSARIIAKRSLKAKYKQAEKLLPAIDALLSREELNSLKGNLVPKNMGKVQRTLDNKHKISGIAVVKGPGPFTALRIGIATANTLGYALKVPLIGILKNESGIMNQELGIDDELISKLEKKLEKAKKGSIVEPEYGREPNITVSDPPDGGER
jgi:hypothetical protein